MRMGSEVNSSGHERRLMVGDLYEPLAAQQQPLCMKRVRDTDVIASKRLSNLLLLELLETLR